MNVDSARTTYYETTHFGKPLPISSPAGGLEIRELSKWMMEGLASGLFLRLGGNSSTGDHLLSVLEGRSPAMSDVKVLSDFQLYAERPEAPESCDSRAFTTC